MIITTEQNNIATKKAFHCFPWGSVFAGVLAAMSAQIVLSFLGTALGLATLSPFSRNDFVSSASYFGIYWWIVSGLISVAVGSFLAAHLSNSETEYDGEAVGFVTWSVLNVIAALFVFIAGGGVLSGTSKVIGAASAVASNTGTEAKILPNDFKNTANTESGQNVIDTKNAAKRASRGAAVTFIALILGLITSLYAGKLGVYYKDPEVMLLFFRRV